MDLSSISLNPLGWLLDLAFWLGSWSVTFLFGHVIPSIPLFLPLFIAWFNFVVDRTNRLYIIGLILLYRLGEIFGPFLNLFRERVLGPFLWRVIKAISRAEALKILQENLRISGYHWYNGPGHFYRGASGIKAQES